MSDQNNDKADKPTLTMQGKADKEEAPQRKMNVSDSFGEDVDHEEGQHRSNSGKTDPKRAAQEKAGDIGSDITFSKNATQRNVIIGAVAAALIVVLIMLLSMCVNTARVAVPAPSAVTTAPVERETFSVDYSGDRDTRPDSANGGEPGGLQQR